MYTKSKTDFWVTWLTPLLAGENSCYWSAWFKARYGKYDKQPRDDQGSLAEWEQKHTELLNDLIDEYSPSGQILIEGQTKWSMVGTAANVSGKMDLIALTPKLVIDAKSGQPKTSHVVQVQIYLLAIQLGAVPALRGIDRDFSGILAYPDSHRVAVQPPTEAFKQRFYALVKRLAGEEANKVPSKFECEFCDIKDCDSRFVESEVEQVLVDAF